MVQITFENFIVKKKLCPYQSSSLKIEKLYNFYHPHRIFNCDITKLGCKWISCPWNPYNNLRPFEKEDLPQMNPFISKDRMQCFELLNELTDEEINLLNKFLIERKELSRYKIVERK